MGRGSRGERRGGCGLSPDGGRILTIADDPGGGASAVAELWTRSGDWVGLLNGVNTSTHARPLFDERGRYLCLPSGRGIAVVDRDGRQLTTLAGAPGTYAVATALSPDGDLVATAFSDGRTRLWNVASRRREMTLRTPDAHALAFSTDSRELLVGSSMGPIIRQPLDVEDLFPAAKARVGRGLRPDELERFGIETALLQLDALPSEPPRRREAVAG